MTDVGVDEGGSREETCSVCLEDANLRDKSFLNGCDHFFCYKVS